MKFLFLAYFSDDKKLFVRRYDMPVTEIKQIELFKSLVKSFCLSSGYGVCQVREISISASRTISDFKRSIVRIENANYKNIEAIAC